MIQYIPLLGCPCLPIIQDDNRVTAFIKNISIISKYSFKKSYTFEKIPHIYKQIKKKALSPLPDINLMIPEPSLDLYGQGRKGGVKSMGMFWEPTIEVESSKGIREVSLATRHLMNRCISLNGTIDSEKADSFMSQLLFLESEPEKPVTLYIHSPGGEVNAGLMIYDCLQGSSLTINTICTGMAASMAAIIFAGGQKGRRFILPHSKIMIHEPLISEGVGGSATSIKKVSDSILDTKKTLCEILSKHTGKTVKQIDKAISFDNFMTAEEAVSFGICDEITEKITV